MRGKSVEAICVMFSFCEDKKAMKYLIIFTEGYEVLFYLTEGYEVLNYLNKAEK